MKEYKILAVNPGSTSTKIAVFNNLNKIFEVAIRHNKEELIQYGGISQQLDMRMNVVLSELKEAGISLSDIDAVVGRGGMVKPMDSGTYTINDTLVEELKHGEANMHASSLGGLIAHKIGIDNNIPSYIVDPVVTDEMMPKAKLTGLPGIERRSVFHALNSKAVARRAAAEIGKTYENSRLVVAHLGGGITVAAHFYGRVIDVNDGILGEGAFSPERSGAVPLVPVIEMCFSGNYTKEELITYVTSGSGMQAFLGTNDLRKVEKMIKTGDSFAVLVLEAMAYQVSKQIGAMVAALSGRVDGIVLTGGLAYSNRFTGLIKDQVDQIAPVYVFPGEDELLSMVQGALGVLTGETKSKVYEG